MANYDFHEDLDVAAQTERDIATLLESIGWTTVEFNNDNKYDLKVFDGTEESTIEIKEDFMARKTGNIAVEYECRGKPSGIKTTVADKWIYKIWINENDSEVWVIDPEDLKNAIRSTKYMRRATGGDAGSYTKMFLFDYETFTKEIATSKLK